MTDASAQKSANTYATILWSYVHGAIRLMQAELATHRLSNAVAEYKSQARGTQNQEPMPSYLVHFEKMYYREWDAFNYVTSLSHMVHATSLLDTFLNDTTKFLLLLHPGAIGKDVKVPTEDLLSAKRPADILAMAVARKAREVSFGSFIQRLDFLRERFSLEVRLSNEFRDQLEHYSSARNVIVHDQGFITLHASDDGAVEFTQHTCARHPTKVAIADLRKAYRTYAEVVRQVGTEILHRVLKSTDQSALEAAISALTKEVTSDSG